MADFEQLLRFLQADTEKINATIAEDISLLETSFDRKLIEVLRYGLLGGGKRIRPLLAVISSRLGGGQPSEHGYTIATAFEYLHAATLFHDDVIDQADTRRGKSSIFKKFGLEAAILAGDFLHARSMEIIGRYGGIECLKVFCRATATMVNGEFLQLRNAENFNLAEEDYYRAIEGKTALLISAATEIGALCGGATEEKRQALREYGRNLGYAFQIVDDLLDYQGDTGKTGKVTGNDLSEGKMTLPMIMAIAHADPEDKKELFAIVQNPEIRSRSFSKVYELIDKHNGFGETRRRADQFVGKALQSLEIFGRTTDVDILAGLARYVLQRDK